MLQPIVVLLTMNHSSTTGVSKLYASSPVRRADPRVLEGRPESVC